MHSDLVLLGCERHLDIINLAVLKDKEDALQTARKQCCPTALYHSSFPVLDLFPKFQRGASGPVTHPLSNQYVFLVLLHPHDSSPSETLSNYHQDVSSATTLQATRMASP